MIQRTSHEDRPYLLSLLKESRQFDADGLEHVAETLDAYLSSPGEEIWYTAVEEGIPVGVAYCRPEPGYHRDMEPITDLDEERG